MKRLFTPDFRLTLRMWSAAAARLVGVLALGALLGVLFNRVFLGLFATLLAYAAWQLVKLFRLDHWLRHRSLLDPPDLGGVWDDVVTQVARIHRRKRHHKYQLVQVLRELRTSTAAVPDGVVLLTPQHEILWFNRTAASLLSLRRKQDVGLRIDNLLRQPEFARYLRDAQFAAPITVRSGVAGDSYLSLHVLPYGAGRRLLLIRDVTRQLKLETLRKEFVASASHELRSPLTVICGYLEALDGESESAAELQKPLREMRREAERMRAIVDDLLQLSRLERSDEEVVGEPIDVPALLAILRKELAARTDRSAVSLQLETSAHLRGDKEQIHSAFSNLADNAVRYTRPGDRILMRWWQDDEGLCFSCEDTGIGIAPEHIARLTDRFYRVDEGRSRATGGSGLGLSIVKHVLQRHGAELEIRSEEGKGSLFVCRFPLNRVVPAQSGSSLPNEPDGIGRAVR